MNGSGQDSLWKFQSKDKMTKTILLIFIETDVKENNPKKGKCTEKKPITILICQQQEKNAFTLSKVREGKLL